MAEILADQAPRKVRDLLNKALAAAEQNNLDFAMDLLEAVLAIEPRLLKARKHLRLIQIRKFKEAKGGQVQHLLSSLGGLGGVMAVKKNIKKDPRAALKAAEALMRKDPLNIQFIKLLDDAARAAELPEIAAMTYEAAREQYPGNLAVNERLANLYLQTNEPQKARECYEDLLRLKPNDPVYIKGLKDAAAIATMQKGGWEGARDFRDVIKNTGEATLLEQENKAVKTDSDLDALIHETQSKIQLEPENMNYRRALADYYVRGLRFDEALATIAAAQTATGRADPQIDRMASNIKVLHYEHKIRQLRAAGQTAEADKLEQEMKTFVFADTEDRVRRYPNDLQFHYEYGVLLFERGRYDDAIGEFQQSQRNPQRRIRSLYYLAMTFKALQQYDIAIEQLQKAATELTLMDELKKDVVYGMGELYELLGKPDKALECFKEIYAVDIRYKDVGKKVSQSYKKK